MYLIKCTYTKRNVCFDLIVGPPHNIKYLICYIHVKLSKPSKHKTTIKMLQTLIITFFFINFIFYLLTLTVTLTFTLTINLKPCRPSQYIHNT